MAQQTPVRAVMIGCGGMARYHIKDMLRQRKTTQIAVVCEPSEAAYAATEKIFADAGLEPPPNQPDLDRLLRDYAGEVDAAFIITPHAYHHDQAVACLTAGVDVLLEKPMVITAAEAESLIAARDKSGRLLVVAFPGSLSPRIRRASTMLRSGELGKILNISGVVWQNWGPNTSGTWRQVPELAGGGFLFDTGAHLLNTVADLAGEDFVEIAAWFDNNGRPVETRGVVIGRLASGGMVTFNACGEAIPSCASDVRIFCEKAILYTGIWGENLSIQHDGDTPPRTIRVPSSLGVWEQFLGVRSGKLENPCPPEVGLRMARLWDAIKESAENGGTIVRTT